MIGIDEFIKVVKKLRAPDGCPWDKKQTMQTLTPYIIEEAYELVEAIKDGNISNVLEELGDVLLQVVMLANIAEEKQSFNFSEVVEHIKAKMIRRHPHVFADTQVDSVAEVWQNWEKIKAGEKKAAVMDNIPKNLPALMQANKIQKKAERMGFDWGKGNYEGPIAKIHEEIAEIRTELHTEPQDTGRIKEEVGDLLFSVVNLARKLEVEPEEALRLSNNKFLTRFQKIEQLSQENKQNLKDLSLVELDKLWDLAKQSK